MQNLTPEPDVNTIWRFTGEGRGFGAILRVVFATNTEIVLVSENSPTVSLYGRPVVADNFPLWSWLGGRFEFFRDFSFIAGNGYNYSRRMGF